MNSRVIRRLHVELDVKGNAMHSGPPSRLSLVSRYYRSYETDDEADMQLALHSDFTFTSPLDDRISRAAFFGRCWPNHEFIKHFDLLDVVADESCALVRYFASELGDGPGFSNMERLEFTGDQIRHIDVYFGREFARIGMATEGSA